MALAKAEDDLVNIGRMKPFEAKAAAKATRDNAATFKGKENYQIITTTPEQGTNSGQTLNQNVQVATKSGKNIKGTGTTNQAKGTPYIVKRPVDSGKVNSAYIKGDTHVGTVQHAIPVLPPVLPPFIPIPGLPGVPTPPVPVVHKRSRIETTEPET